MALFEQLGGPIVGVLVLAVIVYAVVWRRRNQNALKNESYDPEEGMADTLLGQKSAVTEETFHAVLQSIQTDDKMKAKILGTKTAALFEESRRLQCHEMLSDLATSLKAVVERKATLQAELISQVLSSVPLPSGDPVLLVLVSGIGVGKSTALQKSGIKDECLGSGVGYCNLDVDELVFMIPEYDALVGTRGRHRGKAELEKAAYSYFREVLKVGGIQDQLALTAMQQGKHMVIEWTFGPNLLDLANCTSRTFQDKQLFDKYQVCVTVVGVNATMAEIWGGVEARAKATGRGLPASVVEQYNQDCMATHFAQAATLSGKNYPKRPWKLSAIRRASAARDAAVEKRDASNVATKLDASDIQTFAALWNMLQ